MSAEDDDGPGEREVAFRLFAAEFEDADFSYAESDEERAPNYVVTPTGARVNRMFAVGVLTEIEPVGEDVLRARVVDPTGAFVVYAGQYQPEAQTFFERADPPAFVAVSGKARTFQPDDSDVIYTSVRPESVNEVDAETRDRWTLQTAERTLERIGIAAGALQSDARGDDLAEQLRSAGVEESLAAGMPLSIDHYGTTGAYLTALRNLALDTARVVADERDEVETLSLAPGDGGEGDLASLAAIDLDSGSDTTEAVTSESSASASAPDTRAGSAGTAEPTTETSGESQPSVSAEESSESAEPSAVEIAEESSDSDADAQGPSDGSEEPPATTTEATSTESTAEDTAEEDIGDFEPGEFDLDEEVREEVESEYGTEFQSGSEVDDPGEADIETPDDQSTESPDDATGASSAESPASSGTDDAESDTEMDASESDDSEESADTQAASTTTEDVDLGDAVMEAMEDLDDGDGAERQEVVDRVVQRTGEDADAVEDAIQDALMDGRCYEPGDTTLKSI